MNTYKMVIIIICFIISGIISIDIYKNNSKNIGENFIKTNAEITFVSKSGNGIYTKALIMVKYNYENKIYERTIRRAYKNNDYYKTGDKIIINVNKNDPEDVK
jgi:hypothetical protein